ncbi:hypothetical protein SVAN01_05127 [Stagonosporopsis vannaccii]|nr:hypothetical protein SVAN01_05127 [Stagonosporopsis vannaccii]
MAWRAGQAGARSERGKANNRAQRPGCMMPSTRPRREGRACCGARDRGPRDDWRLIHRYWACSQRHARSSERGREALPSASHGASALGAIDPRRWGVIGGRGLQAGAETNGQGLSQTPLGQQRPEPRAFQRCDTLTCRFPSQTSFRIPSPSRLLAHPPVETARDTFPSHLTYLKPSLADISFALRFNSCCSNLAGPSPRFPLAFPAALTHHVTDV